MLVAAIVLAITTPAPPTADGTATLNYIAAHRALYIAHQQLWLVPGVFAMVTYLALYPALKHLDRSLAALGAVVGGQRLRAQLGHPDHDHRSSRAGLSERPVHGHCRSRPTRRFRDGRRDPDRPEPHNGGRGPDDTVGLLIVSIVMLKGVFPRAVAYLGIAVGVLGIASEALRFVFEGAYGVYGALLLVWMGAVGSTLVWLGRSSEPAPPERPAPSPLGGPAAGHRVQ